jgi:hypothetical protein
MPDDYDKAATIARAIEEPKAKEEAKWSWDGLHNAV